VRSGKSKSLPEFRLFFIGSGVLIIERTATAVRPYLQTL